MRISTHLVYSLAAFALLQRCQGQETEGERTTILGRLFGGAFAGGILSLLPTPSWQDLIDGAEEQLNGENADKTAEEEAMDTINDTAENMHFLTCTQSDICFNDSTQTPGAWTCRPQYVGFMSICVPTLLGLTLGREGDTCGCCGGKCPVKCECACTNARGVEGYLAHFNLLFGYVQFDRCLEPTVADAATSFSTLDISCSSACSQQ